MKTIKKVIQETVDKILEERGILAGDLSKVLADAIYTAVQERKDNKGAACPTEWMSALMKLCGASPYTASVALRGQISDCGKALIQSGAELDNLVGFSVWWKNHIAGWTVSAKHPTPKQIRDNWGKYLDDTVGPIVEPTTAAQANASFSQRL